MFSFIKRKKGSSSWQKQQQGKTASSQPTELFHSCSQLPLDKFITALVDRNLSAIVISGEPSPEQLSSAWNNIYYEYLELNASNETSYLFSLENDITLLSDEILNVETCLLYLSPEWRVYCLGREQELISLLRYYGYKQSIDLTSPNYYKVLQVISNKLSAKKLRLNTKQKEFDDFTSAMERKAITRAHFDTQLMRLSRFQGYALRAKDITVAEYIMIFKDCLEANRKEVKE